jgi:GNAT superfamily N-acetyltransferase
MIDLIEDCELVALSLEEPINGFDCNDSDLNEFFNEDALKYQEEMLGQTLFFRHKETKKIVCAFSLSPDGLKTFDLPNSRRKKVKESIPREKVLKSYPAFLIGRLAVAKEFNGQGVGSQLIDYIKSFCLEQYRNFCRFLLVDAYNDPVVLNFYQKNDFIPVFSTEEQERDYYRPNTTDFLRTRYMFYNMMHWKNKMLE